MSSLVYRKLISDMLQRRVNAGGRKPAMKKKAGVRKSRAGLRVGGIGIGGRMRKPRGARRDSVSMGGRKRKAVRKSRGGAVPAHLKKWHAHLMKVRRANPNLSMREAMMKAKKSYR
jgi:hypothetical protein